MLKIQKTVASWRNVVWFLPLTLAGYYEWQYITHIEGFPLDDAYIYWRYVSNIASGNGFAFNPGEVSFGVTSFLFTILCSAIDRFIPWTDTVRVLQLAGVVWYLALIYISQRFVYRHTKNLTLSFCCGALLGSCRPLYFTAPAGLETTMFMTIAILVFFGMTAERRVNPVWLGAGSAILFMTRAEGLLVMAGFTASNILYVFIYRNRLSGKAVKTVICDLAHYLAGFIIAVFPFLAFVKINSGNWMPSTFYGKLLFKNWIFFFPWDSKLREGFRTILDSYQAIMNQDPTTIGFCVLIALSVGSFVFFVFRCGRSVPSARYFAARLTMFSFFILLPFAYGYKFNISDNVGLRLGGYFIRYIQIVIVLFHIEAAIAIHALIKSGLDWIPREKIRAGLLAGCGVAVSVIVLPGVIVTCLNRLPMDLEQLGQHTRVSETVRRQTAYWIRDNTPSDARVLVGTTGLGVVGAFCDRYALDEGGLINPDVYPYLLKYHYGYDHLENMLEYMAQMNLTYYTAFDNPPEYPRFFEKVAEISDPGITWRDAAHLQSASVYRFTPRDSFDLWMDYDEHGTFTDVATNPIVEGRVKPTLWNDIPAIAVDVREVTGEISYDVFFPSNARLTTGFTMDFPPREYDDDETVLYEVYVVDGKKRDIVFSQRFRINECKPREVLKETEINLDRYSARYATLVMAQILPPKKQVGIIWAGWIEPELINANLIK